MASLLHQTSCMAGSANIGTNRASSRLTHTHPSKPFSPIVRQSPQQSRQSVQPRASIAATDLATYQFKHHSLTHGPGAAWFQEAIHEVVKHLDDSPFMQLVQMCEAGQASYTSYHVPEDVVGAPELWQGVAETLSSASPDAVILVQRVDPHAHNPAAQQGNEAEASGDEILDVEVLPPSSSGNSPLKRLHSSEIKSHVEEACRSLVASGVADSILSGKVGDCCDGETHERTNTGPQGTILPFAVAGSGAKSQQRLAVRANAIPHGAAPRQRSSGYWGVVVQGKHHMGVEGCYLLKAVRSDAATGCSCTHFTLTRVCQGENLERQFVNSWLV